MNSRRRVNSPVIRLLFLTYLAAGLWEKPHVANTLEKLRHRNSRRWTRVRTKHRERVLTDRGDNDLSPRIALGVDAQ